MSVELWLFYLAASAGLSLTPGPNGLLSLTHGARFGLRPTVFTVLGGALGFFLLIAASLAGMGALLAASERAFNVAKWLGAAYLVYLGVRLWRAPGPLAGQAPGAEASGDGTGEARPARLFTQGFLVAATNPKALIFFAAFLPQFIVPGLSFGVQLAVFGGTFVVVEILYELIVAGLAQRIAPWLRRYGRGFNRVTGSLFIGLGLVLLGARR